MCDYNKYFNLFIQLSLEQCTKDEYTDRKKVRRHNHAMKKMEKLQNEMAKLGCCNMLCTLLCHQDDRVKINAASMCLKLNIFTNEAMSTLKDIIEVSDDPTTCLSAKMLLQNSL